MTEGSHRPPDMEDLAAYVDGRLSGERKARVEERLLRDEDFYEVFLQTARFQEESRDHKASARVVPRWRSWRLVIPLAAAALLAVLIGLPRLGGGPEAEDFAARLDPQLILAGGESWADPGWSSFRSADRGGRSYSREELAFRLGVRTLDLRIALVGGDHGVAETIAEELEQLASAAGLRPIARAFGTLKGQIGSMELAPLQAWLTDAERKLARSWESSPETLRYFHFGQWVEAGRLAVLAGDADALAHLSHTAPALTESTALVEAIENMLRDNKPNTERFRAVADALSEAVRAFAG